MSLGATVREAAKKMNGLSHITVETSEDNKHYIAEHHSHEYVPEHKRKKFVLKSKGALANHIAEHLKGPGAGGDSGMMGGQEDD